MKTKILGKKVVSGFVLLGLAVLLAASTPDGKELVKMSNALPTTIILVTNTNDKGPGSLRQALIDANDGDTIDATGVSGTILLTSGELQINHNVTINGPGVANLAVNGNATFRVFENFASNVTISGFTVTNGHPADNNGGGGILDHGRLTLIGTSILSNNAGGSTPAPFLSKGGGINSDGGGTLTVTDSVISSNQTGLNVGSGGGISAESGTVTVSNSTISGNQAVGGGLFQPSGGGGIAMGLNGSATLTVTNSNISGNSAGVDGGIGISGMLTVINSAINNNSGGGIGISGTLTVMNSIINGNSAFSGGGIEASGGTVTVSNSTISGNSFFCDGGGIASGGQLTVVNSTISGNISPGGDGAGGCGPEPHGGGGINNGGTATVINSTISGNQADLSATGAGGGIFNFGTLTVTNSTISDNTAAIGGGAVYNTNGGTANIGDTVLNAGAFSGTILNDSGTVTSLGYNLASDNGGDVLTGPGDRINTNPLLGPLQDNGGPTFTQALLPGSPAINAGNLIFITPPPRYDQRGRGFPRIVHGRIDIGSFEVQRQH